MNQEEKQARHNELKRIIYPSDQEIEEMEQLKEELSISQQEDTTSFKETKVELGTGKVSIVPTIPQKKYRGLISGRIEKWRDERKEKNKLPPATRQEIYQLQLELKRAELLRDLQQTQQEGRSKRNYWDIFRNVVGTNNSPINKERPRKKTKDPATKISKGLDHISGKNDKKDYSALF